MANFKMNDTINFAMNYKSVKNYFLPLLRLYFTHVGQKSSVKNCYQNERRETETVIYFESCTAAALLGDQFSFAGLPNFESL
jgi:hypothetical protein